MEIVQAKCFSDVLDRSKSQNGEIFNAISMAEDILGKIDGVIDGDSALSDKKEPVGLLDQLYNTVEVRQLAIVKLIDLLHKIKEKC